MKFPNIIKQEFSNNFNNYIIFLCNIKYNNTFHLVNNQILLKLYYNYY